MTYLTTALTELAGCRAPVQQAPMGSVSTPELAVAVAEAGGIGSITALGMDASPLATILDDMTARTDGVRAANFLTDHIDPAAVATAAARVRIVDFFWTDPAATLVAIVHRAGALACCAAALASGAAGVRAGTRFVATRESGAHPAYKQAVAVPQPEG